MLIWLETLGLLPSHPGGHASFAKSIPTRDWHLYPFQMFNCLSPRSLGIVTLL